MRCAHGATRHSPGADRTRPTDLRTRHGSPVGGGHRSIGSAPPTPIAHLAAVCRSAEQLGADALWACDHLFWHGPVARVDDDPGHRGHRHRHRHPGHLRGPAPPAPGPGGGQAGGQPADAHPGDGSSSASASGATPASTSRPASTTTPGVTSSTPASPSCAGRGPPGTASPPATPPARPRTATGSCPSRRPSRCGWAAPRRRPCAGRPRWPTDGCPSSCTPPSTARPSSAWPRRSTGPVGPPTRSPPPSSCSCPSTTIPRSGPSRGTGWMSSLYGIPAKAFERHIVSGTAAEVADVIAAFRGQGPSTWQRT